MPDDDDRPRDASSAGDHARFDAARDNPAVDDADWSNAAAPDDISELVADVAAYHRELRTARRRAWLRRHFGRVALAPLSLIAAGLALAAVVAMLITVMEPDAVSKGPAPLSLASAPSASVGQVHGLLPDVPLVDSDGISVSARTLRPGVLALIPLHCQCVPLLNRLASAADTEALPLIVVAPTIKDAEAQTLSAQLDTGRPAVYYDSSDSLAGAFHAQGVTVVVLDRDGTIYDIQKAVPSTGSPTLVGQLHAMLARTSG